MKSFTPRIKSGRAFNGSERDAGSIVHAVSDTDYPSWEPALCGTAPGVRGNGWQEPEIHKAITCEKCRVIIEK